MLAIASVAQAASWRGLAALASDPGGGVALTAEITTSRRLLRGRIVGCAAGAPCPFAGARLALDVTPYAPSAGEHVERLSGTMTLVDGSACTFTGDVWNVRVSGRRVRSGALHGQVTCPALGAATLSLWVKRYRQPPSDT